MLPSEAGGLTNPLGGITPIALALDTGLAKNKA